MNDYRYTFPVTALERGLLGIAALVAELKAESSNSANNALGDPRDADGNIVVFEPSDEFPPPPSPVVWYGRPGSRASSYTDLNGDLVLIPARGDPTLYYIHIRSEQEAGGFQPTQHAMTSTDLVDSAAVLGIWLGDEVPVR